MKKGQYVLYLTREDEHGMPYKKAECYLLSESTLKKVEKFLAEIGYDVDTIVGQKPEINEQV